MNKAREREMRRIENNKLTRHHIINKSRHNVYNSLHHQQNIVELARYKHQAHHSLFANADPHETLAFYSFFTQVMSKRARELYTTLLSMSPEEFYDKKFTK